MGIDKSLTDDFPSVFINGTEYHYGRCSRWGDYLVENAEYAKDYWCFHDREDLLAFLFNLPESADRGWIKRRHPKWDEVSDQERRQMGQEHKAFLRSRMEEKRASGEVAGFRVLRFDEGGGPYFSHPTVAAHTMGCAHVELQVQEHATAKNGMKNLLVDLRLRPPQDGSEERTFTISTAQALKLAESLIAAVQCINTRLLPPSLEE